MASTPATPTATGQRRLHPAALRLIVVSLLFACWIGYLIYLVVSTARLKSGEPLIVSRSQILVSQIDVVARVDDPNSEVVIEQVLFPAEQVPAALEKGKKLRVPHLMDCRPPPTVVDGKLMARPLDWTGPGSYIVPLQKQMGSDDQYEVTPTPPSPSRSLEDGSGWRRIYPATPAALAQYRKIAKPK